MSEPPKEHKNVGTNGNSVIQVERSLIKRYISYESLIGSDFLLNIMAYFHLHFQKKNNFT